MDGSRITREQILARLADRVIIMDGAMGTMLLQSYSPVSTYSAHNSSNIDYEGQSTGNTLLKHKTLYCLGDLCISDPERVAQIHRSYIQSGAELIETNTFKVTAFSGQECRSDKIYELSRCGAEIARKVSEEEALSFMLGDDNILSGDFSAEIAEDRDAGFDKTYGTEMSLKEDVCSKWKAEWGPRRAIVAGCIGACGQSEDAFRIQAEGLLDGGADVLLLEGIYDFQIAENACDAIAEVLKRKGEDIPVMASATIDREGRILSGEDFRTVFGRLEKYGVFSMGFNCSMGAEAMLPFATELAEFTCGRESSGSGQLRQPQANTEVGEDILAKEYPVSICPSAGLPDNEGQYPEDPEFWASCLQKMISRIEREYSKSVKTDTCVAGKRKGCFAGGCCGTTPDYIKALKDSCK